MDTSSKSLFKTLGIIVLVFFNFISFVYLFDFLIADSCIQITPCSKCDIVTVGFSQNPHTIDPVDTWDHWDRHSENVERQVIQGLVQYNLSTHPKYEIMGVLATNWRWHGIGAKKITFKLREGVKFHDGEEFDADAIIWNLERLTYFCNYSGNLQDNSTSWLAFPASMYYFHDGTPIIANYYKNSKYNVTIELNSDFAPFLDLLTLVPSYALSPKSTPKYSYLNDYYDKLIGTGPFIYDHFLVDNEVRFHRNEQYWGDPPWPRTLIFDINEDDISRSMDMLTLKIDYLQEPLIDMLNTYNQSIYHTVNAHGGDLCYYYLEFYSGPPFNDTAGKLEPFVINGKVNQRLNSTWRRALSLAINYSQIWEIICESCNFPGYPAVSREIPGYNNSLEGKMITDFPFDDTYEGNIKIARELMQSMGYGYDGPGKVNPWNTTYPSIDDIKWSSAMFRSINLDDIYGFNTNNQINKILGYSWQLIGVVRTVNVWHWEDYLDHIKKPWDLDVRYTGWCPDYFDAFGTLDPIFNNESPNCYSLIGDPKLSSLLETAAKTTDLIIRQDIYKEIQSYVFDITRKENPSSYCHAPLFYREIYQVHSAGLYGVNYNSLNILDCWNWYK